jgi:hypothetical protein
VANVLGRYLPKVFRLGAVPAKEEPLRVDPAASGVRGGYYPKRFSRSSPKYCMMNFKTWLEGAEEDKDVRKTLAKVPKAHSALLRGYKFFWQDGNTLKNDPEHIGFIKGSPENIVTIASPWNYGREYTLLHELGHLVWAKFVPAEKREQWQHVVNNTKDKQNQNAEELFCMAYANTYANNKIEIHSHPEWERFIKSIA